MRWLPGFLWEPLDLPRLPEEPEELVFLLSNFFLLPSMEEKSADSFEEGLGFSFCLTDSGKPSHLELTLGTWWGIFSSLTLGTFVGFVEPC